VTRRTLSALVAQAVPVLLNGALDDVVDDTGGLGLCHDVSSELATWMHARGYDARCYWPTENHCVVRLEGWIVDLTARQFNPRAPYPKLTRYRSGTPLTKAGQ
jgi:hypothetical protein